MIMKTVGMPAAMWLLFAGSFEKQLSETLPFSAERAKEIAGSARCTRPSKIM